MKTVLLGPPKKEVEELIARRRALGQDRHDEVWEGEYHMAPDPHSWHGMVVVAIALALEPHARGADLRGGATFNLGGPNDFRTPDGGYHRGAQSGVWLTTAAIVVQVLSPDDETFEKFDFYFGHGVEEILVADPQARTIRWFTRGADAFVESAGSVLLGITSAELHSLVDWPR